MALPPVSVHLQRSSGSYASDFLNKNTDASPASPDDSDLLKEIREALRGAPTSDDAKVNSFRLGDSHLRWNDTRVILTVGGLLKRQWDFSLEKQKVEYACIGQLQHVTPTADLGSHDYMFPATSAPTEPEKTSFGPFRESEKPSGYNETQFNVLTVFIFLRRIGMAFMNNGTSFTFSVPFVVRQAWPMSPIGVLIQRSVDPYETVDADEEDPVLPTIYTLSSPLGEISALGVTSGIAGLPPRLVDEDERSHSTLPTIPYDEWVIWVSQAESYRLFVTFHVEEARMTIWRYQHIPQNSAPQPLPRERIRERARKRQSISSRDMKTSEPFNELLPLSAFPEMPPALTGTKSLQSLIPKELPSLSDTAEPFKQRRNSLSDSLDRMKMDDDTSYLPVEHGRMKTSFWAQKLYEAPISRQDAENCELATAALYDHRWDGTADSITLAVLCVHMQKALLFRVVTTENHAFTVRTYSEVPARSIAAVRATRRTIDDLLVVSPYGKTSLLTLNTLAMPLMTVIDVPAGAELAHTVAEARPNRVCCEKSGVFFQLNEWSSLSLAMFPRTPLTQDSLHILALCMTEDVYIALTHSFLSLWSEHGFRSSDDVEFTCFTRALYTVCAVEPPAPEPSTLSSFNRLTSSPSHFRFSSESSFKLGGLKLPTTPPSASDWTPRRTTRTPQPLLTPIFYGLHMLAENYRLATHRYKDIRKLVPVICHLAAFVRPEWADYWRRLCPSACPSIVWPSSQVSDVPFLDDRISIWPPDASAILYGRIANPEWDIPNFSLATLGSQFDMTPSYAFGQSDPLNELKYLIDVYQAMSDTTVTSTQKRAENAVPMIFGEGGQIMSMLDMLPLGIAAPVRESIRTCQLVAPMSWPARLYRAIGREDVAASTTQKSNVIPRDGYKGMKEFIGAKNRRLAISTIISDANVQAAGEIGRVTGVELEHDDFSDIRFGIDRRFEDVLGMLSTSGIRTYRPMATDRPEQMSEIELTKEYQHQAVRVAERTIALTHGRAMLSYGAVSRVNRQSYAIPQMCYSIRIHPHNILVDLDMKHLSNEAITWGEFHNGVAAGLRISPYAEGVEASWISFNKPGELSAAHAGFLFGLGLSGHLKRMVAWNTFQYLTPKHDLTSIGVLLGLAAANVGTGNRKVTKLLAVHTPALLPTPSVDLNISLMTQSAGLIGMGLLYMGTKHRRYADVCLREISRKDLFEANLHSEYRETYVISAAMGFGMIMLGRGSSIPADTDVVDRLTVLIHGELPNQINPNKRPTFDTTLTSPAATIALGLMYLRTDRQDIADILKLPDTVLGLNGVQPSFLLVRVIARALIMWSSVAPTTEWLEGQIPLTIRTAFDLKAKHGTPVDDALDLAYHNIIAGSCFVVGLKYAGTARQEAYKLIIRHYDLFTRLIYTNGPTYDLRIKRSTVRDGLNLLSVSLSLVMAGTGEITTFRRLRYAYGMFNQTMYHPTHKYGIHVATYQAIGMLFLGGGRFTLGTSDSAIASMVIAFFPRYAQTSGDNKVYLQALQHLWVLAVEPRCLVARDVETKDVVYLPLKLSVREGKEIRTTQLISPTLTPEINNITSIRIDTPRYWAFQLDVEKVKEHRIAFIRSQTLFVKRRTAFLSYTEDPRGSRSLFVRSRSSVGEAAILDYPQLVDTKTHPASDLSEFITSFSNDPIYLAFADHFGAMEEDTNTERVFFNYCHAALYDSILQSKQQSLQSHLTLFMYRTMKMQDPYFHMRLYDMRFVGDFYRQVFERRFSGISENNHRTPLVRESTVTAAMFSLDQRLDEERSKTDFLSILGKYTSGEDVVLGEDDAGRLAWYMLRNNVPVSTLLGILKTLARDAFSQCFPGTPPGGTMDSASLDKAITEVLHSTGSRMTTNLAAGWSVRSLDEIVELWRSDASAQK